MVLLWAWTHQFVVELVNCSQGHVINQNIPFSPTFFLVVVELLSQDFWKSLIYIENFPRKHSGHDRLHLVSILIGQFECRQKTLLKLLQIIILFMVIDAKSKSAGTISCDGVWNYKIVKSFRPLQPHSTVFEICKYQYYDY